MEEVTLEDLREAIGLILSAKINNYIELADIEDENLMKCDLEKDMQIRDGPMVIIEQLGKSKHLLFNCELYKCVPDNKIETLIDTINLYLKTAEELGVALYRKDAQIWY